MGRVVNRATVGLALMAGESMASIARRLGVSRQRIHQIAHEDGFQLKFVKTSEKPETPKISKGKYLSYLTIQKLGGKCVRCGFSDVRGLQIDHVDGGGCREARSVSRSRFLKRVLRHPERYQVLCANCNWIKRDENQEVRKGKTAWHPNPENLVPGVELKTRHQAVMRDGLLVGLDAPE